MTVIMSQKSGSDFAMPPTILCQPVEILENLEIPALSVGRGKTFYSQRCILLGSRFASEGGGTIASHEIAPIKLQYKL